MGEASATAFANKDMQRVEAETMAQQLHDDIYHPDMCDERRRRNGLFAEWYASNSYAPCDSDDYNRELRARGNKRITEADRLEMASMAQQYHDAMSDPDAIAERRRQEEAEVELDDMWRRLAAEAAAGFGEEPPRDMRPVRTQDGYVMLQMATPEEMATLQW